MAERGEVEQFLPLPASVMHIVVALADGEKHGYAILRDVAAVSDGAVRMGSGTLYGSIKRMLDQGLIEEADERPDPALDDQRRRYYRLTELGQRVGAAEITASQHWSTQPGSECLRDVLCASSSLRRELRAGIRR
jgi:DNA-binding PadR family transcriptional regulator